MKNRFKPIFNPGIRNIATVAALKLLTLTLLAITLLTLTLLALSPLSPICAAANSQTHPAQIPQAPGAVSGQDLLVRYAAPLFSTLDAADVATHTIARTPFTRLDLLNSSEGLVKLHFKTPADATAAKGSLERSDRVLQVSPNHLYRPAVTFHFKSSAPFSTLSASGFPDLLPSQSIQPAGPDPLAEKDWALGAIRLPSIEELAALDHAAPAASSVTPSAAAAPSSAPFTPVITAIIDTGIDYNHEDLAAALWHNPVNPREIGYDFAHGNDRPYDVVKYDAEGCFKDASCRLGISQDRYIPNAGHGTHCAGHVGAVANNGKGIRGVGSNRTELMTLKFFFDAGEENAGSGDDAAAIQSIDYAIQNHARVISISWGARFARNEGEASELKAALLRAQAAHILVVIAAGNEAIDQDAVPDPAYPAAYDLDNLIVVAATDPQDHLASFSSFGGKSVHLAAPGVKILSTTVGSTYSDVIAKFADEKGHTQELDWDGTSMSAPLVAGAVSLVWSQFPDADYHEIRNRILTSVRKVPTLEGKVVTGGVLDVRAALTGPRSLRPQRH